MEAHETRVALVTGGNRGIGPEICRQVSSLGHRVVVTARDARRADEAARGLAGWASGDTAGVPVDVTDDESVRGAFEQAVELYGAVDVLVNNAGIAIDGSSIAHRRPTSSGSGRPSRPTSSAPGDVPRRRCT